MKFFVHVANTGCITVAAKDLGIVQPALSRHIQRLEEEVGVPLFHRLPRGVILTDSGRLFHERCLRILHEYALARNDLLASREALEGAVAFGMPGTLSPALAPRIHARLRAEAPNITLKIIDGASPAVNEALTSGRVHTAILTNPTPTTKLVIEPLATEAIAVFCPRGAPDARAAFPVGELGQIPVVVSPGVRRLIDEQLFDLGRQLNVEAEVESIAAIRRMVIEGESTTLLPVSTLRDDVEAGLARAFPVIGINLRRGLALVRPVDGVTPATEAVMQIARLEVARLAEEGAFSDIPAHRTLRPEARTQRRPPVGASRPAVGWSGTTSERNEEFHGI